MNKKENQLPKIGYVYHYPRLDHPTEKFRLDIFVADTPTEQHFDVTQVHFFAKTPEGRMKILDVRHPWTLEKSVQVYAGKVVLEDRNHKKKEAFTFGGDLRIQNRDAYTLCSLHSSAPIFDISDSTYLYKLFVDELEILFAERQAMVADHTEYEAILGETDPLSLYLACLKTLLNEFEDFPHKKQIYRQFLFFLHTEKRRLDEVGIHIESAKNLDEIFKAASA